MFLKQDLLLWNCKVWAVELGVECLGPGVDGLGFRAEGFWYVNSWGSPNAKTTGVGDSAHLSNFD